MKVVIRTYDKVWYYVPPSIEEMLALMPASGCQGRYKENIYYIKYINVEHS